MASTNTTTEAYVIYGFFEKPTEWVSLVFEVIGFFFSIFILGLSTIRHKEGFNVGPRIFAANLMFVNIVLTVVTFMRDYGQVNESFVEFYYSLGEFAEWRSAIQYLALLIFNCSFVPMMAVTLISLYSTHILSTKKTIALFAGAVIVSDFLPTIFQVINVMLLIPPGYPKGRFTVSYIAVCCGLYVIQLALTAICLAVIYKKSQSESFSGRTKEEARQKLVRTMFFAIGPCVIQIPFAIFILTSILKDYSSFWRTAYIYLSNIVNVVFALKPTVDALSLLVFMGEYRRYTTSFISSLRGGAKNLLNLKTFKTKVEHLPSGHTVTVAPVARTHVHTIT